MALRISLIVMGISVLGLFAGGTVWCIFYDSGDPTTPRRKRTATISGWTAIGCVVVLVLAAVVAHGGN